MVHPSPSSSSSRDITPLFRQQLASHPPPTHPRSNPHRRPPTSLPQPQQASWRARRSAEQTWNAEAAKLRRSIDDLDDFLAQVRRPYLHSGPVFPLRHLQGEGREEEQRRLLLQQQQQQQQQQHSQAGTLERYVTLTSLSEAEKDQVDLHLQLVLEKAVTRLKELIKAEGARQKSQPTPESSTLTSTSLLTRLLSRPLPSTSLDSLEYSSQLADHREAITASLGDSLKRVGERLGQMQEARARQRQGPLGKRIQRDTSRTAASHSRGQGGEQPQPKAIQGSTASFRAIASTSTRRSQISPSGSSSFPTTSGQHQPLQAEGQGPVEEEEEELTQTQLQLFQSESSSLTKTLQADLDALQGVTSTLSTIASLQTTLIQHLSVQNETIASLGTEAGEHRVEVQRGNEQLKKARQRNRSANRLLGALLVGSGLGLLFLHVMD